MVVGLKVILIKGMKIKKPQNAIPCGNLLDTIKTSTEKTNEKIEFGK